MAVYIDSGIIDIKASFANLKESFRNIGTSIKVDAANIGKDIGKSIANASTEEIKNVQRKIEEINKVRVNASKIASGFNVNGFDNITDKIIKAADIGKVRYEEFGNSINKLTPMAANLKVSTDHLFASMATLTKNGMTTSDAMLGLEQAFRAIIKPNKDAVKTAQELGIEFNTTHLKSVGFVKFLDEIKEKTGGSTEKLNKLFGSAKAFNAIASLTGNGTDDFAKALKEIQQSSGLADMELEKLNKTLAKTDKQMDAINRNKISDFSKKIKTGLSGTVGAVKSVGAEVAKVGAVVTTAITTAGVGMFKLAEKASDLSEAQNVVQETFKTSGDSVIAWAKTMANAAGISQTSATKMVGSMGAMLKSSGLAEKDAKDMSQALVQLTGDMSSFYNLNTEEAWEKIRSGISGETEPLKQLGINMSVANMEAFALSQGIKKSWNAMSQGEQTMLRYQYLMKVTADAQGDFARTLDTSFANQLRVMKMNIESLGTSIGQKFLPDFMNLIKALNQGISTGDWNKATEDISKSIQGVVTNIVNLIPNLVKVLPSVLGGLIKSIVTALPTVIPQIITAVVDLAKILAAILKDNARLIVDAILEGILALVDGITDILPTLVEVAITIVVALAEGIIKALPKLIEKLPKIIESIVQAIVQNIPLIIKAGIEMVIALTVGLIKNIPLIIKTAIQLMAALAKGVFNAFKNIDWSKLGKDMLISIGKGVVSATAGLIETIGNAWAGVKELFNGLFKGLENVARTSMQNIKDNILGTISDIKDGKFGKLTDNAIKVAIPMAAPLVNKYKPVESLEKKIAQTNVTINNKNNISNNYDYNKFNAQTQRDIRRGLFAW